MKKKIFVIDNALIFCYTKAQNSETEKANNPKCKEKEQYAAGWIQREDGGCKSLTER